MGVFGPGKLGEVSAPLCRLLLHDAEPLAVHSNVVPVNGVHGLLLEDGSRRHLVVASVGREHPELAVQLPQRLLEARVQVLHLLILVAGGEPYGDQPRMKRARSVLKTSRGESVTRAPCRDK